MSKTKKRTKQYPKSFDGLSVALVPLLGELRRWEAAAKGNRAASERARDYYGAIQAESAEDILSDLVYNLEALPAGHFSDFRESWLRAGGRRVRKPEKAES